MSTFDWTWTPAVCLGVAWLSVACTRPAGPEAGLLLAMGGGEQRTPILQEAAALAGGLGVSTVVIPTARTDKRLQSGEDGLADLLAAGFTDVRVLHTRDRAEADSEDFVSPLRDAGLVWFTGGRQWRLVDAYLDTLTHRELRAVLDRGGVVAGTSAGATMLASFLVRGSPSGNNVLVDRAYARGFGFAEHLAIDQHWRARDREADLAQVLANERGLTGLGVDEHTAVIIRHEGLSVIGEGQVGLYRRDLLGGDEPFVRLHPGDHYGLRTGRVRRAGE